MPSKFGALVRTFWASDVFLDKLKAQVTTSSEIAPGQLRRRGEVFLLTFLRGFKAKKVNLADWEHVDVLTSSICAVRFTLLTDGSKILVHGNVKDLRDIKAYFEAVALDGASGEINFDDHYKINDPIVDFKKLCHDVEMWGEPTPISIGIDSVLIKLGTIDHPIVKTSSYEDVLKLFEDGGRKILSMSLKLSGGIKLSVSDKGMVKLTSKDLDSLAMYDMGVQVSKLI